MTKRAVEQQRHSARRVIEVIARDPQYKFNEADSSQDVLQLFKKREKLLTLRPLTFQAPLFFNGVYKKRGDGEFANKTDGTSVRNILVTLQSNALLCDASLCQVDPDMNE